MDPLFDCVEEDLFDCVEEDHEYFITDFNMFHRGLLGGRGGKVSLQHSVLNVMVYSFEMGETETVVFLAGM